MINGKDATKYLKVFSQLEAWVDRRQTEWYATRAEYLDIKK
jgi:hypothetical protein